MEPRYSVLLYNKRYEDCCGQLDAWLASGIRVIWFGSDDSILRLKDRYPGHHEIQSLLTYPLAEQGHSFCITDGNCDEKTLHFFRSVYPGFNTEQYRVEHCRSDGHIIVEASAGTGKTKVMIDRIMFLLHTVPDIALSDIAMITFTNEATEQMYTRLQKTLLARYKLTGCRKYLYWLEHQSDIKISTIDSFSYDLIRRCGVVNGLSQGVRIRSMAHERKELIRDTINRMAVSGHNVIDQFGLSYYSLCTLTDRFWQKIAQLGLSPKDAISLDWGQGSSPASQKFQTAFSQIIKEAAAAYDTEKSNQDAVTLQDMRRDLNNCLPMCIRQHVLNDIGFKYLFVDEFQDSDDSQITLLANIVRCFDVRLFAVGDAKQSIYRFRGSVDSAFAQLEKLLAGERKIFSFALRNNYRTAPAVMTAFERYFQKWAELGCLPQAQPSVPCRHIDGSIEFIRTYMRGFDEKSFVDIVRGAVEDLRKYCAETGSAISEKNRVVILTRTNKQLAEIAQLLDKHQIPAIVRRDGNFYTSEAIRDFFSFINAFVYASEPMFLFSFLCSPFSGLDRQIQLDGLISADGNKDVLRERLAPYLAETGWGHYDRQFRIRPVLSVIKDVIDDKRYLKSIIARKKQIRAQSGWAPSDIAASVHAEALQYQADLEKLLLILQQNFGSDGVSLNTISQYLKLAIATDRNENEAQTDVSTAIPLYCMTVHKAKGLEFDTVILPFTDDPFFFKNQTELLVSNDRHKIAWNIYDRRTGMSMRNHLYEQVRAEEDDNATAEETRILYVAMTRTIRNFKCILGRTTAENTWAGLIWKEGIPDDQKDIYLHRS